MVRSIALTALMSAAAIGVSQADMSPDAWSPRTLPSLLTDGFEITGASLVHQIVWLRKWSTTYTVTYICVRPIAAKAAGARDDTVSCWPVSAGESY